MPHDKLTSKERSQQRRQMWPGDIDTAWQYLVSQLGVKGTVIGTGGPSCILRTWVGRRKGEFLCRIPESRVGQVHAARL
jgi:hypothetical protein